MKQLLLLLFTLSLAFTTSTAQCKYKENKTDEFTGKRIKRVKKQKFYLNIFKEYLIVQPSNINGTRFIRVEWSTLSIRSIYEGDKIMFILSNGERAEIIANEYEISTISGNVWLSTLYYYMPPAQFEKLKAANIVKYRIYSKGGYTEKSLAEKKADKFRKSMLCIE